MQHLTDLKVIVFPKENFPESVIIVILSVRVFKSNIKLTLTNFPEVNCKAIIYLKENVILSYRCLNFKCDVKNFYEMNFKVYMEYPSGIHSK